MAESAGPDAPQSQTLGFLGDGGPIGLAEEGPGVSVMSVMSASPGPAELVTGGALSELRTGGTLSCFCGFGEKNDVMAPLLALTSLQQSGLS